MSNVQMTHSDDCWKWHHECAKLAVEELAIDKERLRAENERLVKEVEHWREARRTALLAGDVLKAENERLRADAERYRWLSSQPGSYPALARFVVSAAGTAKHGFATPLDVYKAVDLDAAIDAAMKREGER